MKVIRRPTTTTTKDCSQLNTSLTQWNKMVLVYAFGWHCGRPSNGLHSLLIYFWAVACKRRNKILTRTRSVIWQPAVLTDSSKERRLKIRQRVHTGTLIYCCLKKINISESLNHKLFSIVFFRNFRYSFHMTII